MNSLALSMICTTGWSNISWKSIIQIQLLKKVQHVLQKYKKKSIHIKVKFLEEEMLYLLCLLNFCNDFSPLVSTENLQFLLDWMLNIKINTSFMPVHIIYSYLLWNFMTKITLIWCHCKNSYEITLHIYIFLATVYSSFTYYTLTELWLYTFAVFVI